MNEEVLELAEVYCKTTAAQLEGLDSESRAYVLAMMITSTIDQMVKHKGPKSTADRLNQIAADLRAVENAEKMKKH